MRVAIGPPISVPGSGPVIGTMGEAGAPTLGSGAIPATGCSRTSPSGVQIVGKRKRDVDVEVSVRNPPSATPWRCRLALRTKPTSCR